MKPERLQEIAEPLETFLENKGFCSDEEPLVDGIIRMASFSDAEERRRIDYTLEVKKDEDNGPFSSDTELYLQVDLFEDDQEPIPLHPYLEVSMNMPAPTVVEDIIDTDIRPNLLVVFNSDC